MKFRLLILFLAIGAGGVAAWFAFVLQSSQAPATTIVETERAVTSEVLVATVDLGLGTAVTPDKVRWQAWPEALVNPAFIIRSGGRDAIAELQGSVVRNRIVAGEPVRQDKLARSDSGFLATLLPSGKRAVAVRVSAEKTAGGFILPNDRVDVIQTVSGPSGAGHAETVSTTLLTNIRVLAIDQMIDQTTGQTTVAGEPSPAASSLVGRTATLELDSRQAETIIAAESSGMLSLALRSAADAGEVQQERQAAGYVLVIRKGRGQTVRLRHAGSHE